MSSSCGPSSRRRPRAPPPAAPLARALGLLAAAALTPRAAGLQFDVEPGSTRCVG